MPTTSRGAFEKTAAKGRAAAARAAADPVTSSPIVRSDDERFSRTAARSPSRAFALIRVKYGVAIETAMIGVGYAAETRPYHPHVTIARLRFPRAIREIVLPMAEQMFGDTRIDAVTLFESETKSTGSVYHEVRKISFERASRGAVLTPKRQTGALERGTPDREPDDSLTDDGWPRGQGPTE